jgi:Ca-activated chloride channel family protein
MNFLETLIGQLYWREPLWLLLGLFPFALMLWKRSLQQASLRQYADSVLHPWVKVPQASNNNRWPLIAQLTIWLLLGIAASGPRLLTAAPDDLLPAQGAAIIIMDQSRSMLASDVYPSRLQQAHHILSQWTDEAHPAKAGLIVFAGASHIALPPTHDQSAFQQASKVIRKLQLPTHGSAILASLKQATSLLLNQDGERTIIVLTDGDYQDQEWSALKAIAPELENQQITVQLLGVGTPSPIALSDQTGRWLMQNGTAATTRLNEAKLKSLADSPNITYKRLNPEIHHQLSNVWQPRPARLTKEHENQVLWQELFPWFLVPAILLLIGQYMRLPRHLEKPVSITATSLLVTSIIFILLQPQQSHASTYDDLLLAHQAWNQQAYEKAASLYAQIQGYDARIGEGASCFRSEDMSCAITAFSQAAWQASTDQQRGVAAYNLANSFFHQGNFPAAITQYEDALRYQPDEERYQNNLNFSKEVQGQIELRMRQEAASLDKRLGPGWRTRRIEEGLDISPNISVILDDEPDNETSSQYTPQLSDEQIKQYMQRGEAYARLSKQQGQQYQRQHDWSQFSNTEPAAAHQVEFWQRLFELEEDILVSPDAPKIIPGVTPW